MMKTLAVIIGFIFLMLLFISGQAMGQSTSLLPVTKAQWITSTGTPLAGGKVYTYAAGTTTFLAAYRDSTLTNAYTTNPITLDSNGRADIWLGPSYYRVKVTTSLGAAVTDVDNVFAPGINAVSASGTLTTNYIPRVANGSLKTLQNSQTTDDGTSITAMPSDGRLDATSWSQSLWRLSRLQNSSSNQFTMNIQTVDNIDSGAAASYEKAGLLIQTMTTDPSGVTSRDMVGLDTRCQIWSTISTGRCWGGISEATVTSGGDGLAFAHEFAVDNAGTNQPLVDTATSKYGIHLVAGQSATYTTPITAAIYINAGFGTWRNGIVAKQGVFSGDTSQDSFITLYKALAATPVFRVKTSGKALIGDLSNAASTGDYNSTIYGDLTVNQYMTVASHTTGKNLMGLFVDESTSTVRLTSGHYDTLASSWPLTFEVGNQSPTGTTPAMRINLDGGIQFAYNAASAGLSAVGQAKMRNNNGQLEVSNNGGAYAAIPGSGGSGVSGTGTTGYISKFSAATSITNTSAPLVEYNVSTDYSLVFGETSVPDPTQISIEGFKSSTVGSYILARNNSTGTTAYAGVAARIGALSNSTLDVVLAVTSSGFTPSTPLVASEAFIRTGASTIGGLVLNTPSGAISFAPDGSAIDYKMTTDDALEFSATSAAAVGGAGTARLRNNGGQLEVSNNGAAFVALPGAGGSGIGGSGTSGYISKFSALTTVNNTSGPLFEDATGINCLVYGATGCDDSAQMKIEAIAASTTGGDIVVRNSTVGTTSFAAVGARSGAGGSTNDVIMAVTSASFTPSAPLSASQGFIKTGTNATNGLVIQTIAGNVNFAPAGTAINAKFTSDNALELTTTSSAAVGPANGVRLRSSGGTLQVSENGGAYVPVIGSGGITGTLTTNLVPSAASAAVLSNSQIFDDGTSTSVGTQAATDDTAAIRFEVRKDRNGTSAILMRNNSNGGGNTSAAASVAARVGSANLDVAITVTSSAYSAAPAASAGMLYSGTDATGGLYIKSGAGSIHFQAATGSDNCALTSAGLMTCTSFSGSGASLTSLNGSQVNSGVVPYTAGGTSSTSQTSGGVNYFTGSAITSSSNLTYSSGSALNITGASYNVVTSGFGMTFANGSSSIAGSATVVDLFPGGSERLRADTTATNGVCVYIGGSLQRLGLSGSNVIVLGAC